MIELLRLKALAVVVLLFIGVYVRAFVVTALIKPRPQVAIPLVIGISLAIVLVFIFFLSSDAAGFA